MKKHCVAALCCLLLAGCTKPVTRQVGEGQVAFACELLDAVGVTRSTTRPLPEGSVPASSDLKLVLSGTESEPLTYETMADYDMPMLTAGDYSARFTYGDPTAEGAGKGYFEGSCSFAVVARKTITQAGDGCAGQFALYAEPVGVVRQLLYRLRPDGAHRGGSPDPLLPSSRPRRRSPSRSSCRQAPPSI